MKKLPLPIFILLFLVISCSKTDDTLSLKIQKITDLQKKAKFLITPSSFNYLKSADSIIAISKKLPDSVLIENIFSKGYCYRQLGQLDSASTYLNLAIGKINRNNARKRDLIYYRNSWETDLTLEKYGDVVSSAQKFINLLDRDHNYEDLIYAYNTLERVNLYLTNYEKALLYNDSVQQVATATSNKEMSYITSSSRARSLYYFNKTDEAFQLMDSLSTSLEGNDVQRQFYRDYGILYYYKSDFKSAISNYQKSLFYLKQIKETEIEDRDKELLEAYLNITEAYTELREYKLAAKYLDTAITYVNSNTTFDNLSFVGETRLKLKYLNTNNIDDLLVDYRALVGNQNRIHEKKIDDELYALKLANEKEKELLSENKQREISNLKLQAWFAFILILIVLLTIIGLLFYRQKRLRFERNDLLLHQRLLRSQMNPHFTFNALYAIKNHIATDQKTATSYLLRFSRLLRLILENSVKNFVELQSELELLDKYMELQLLRFPEKFTYNVSLKNIADDDLLFIPPMLLQPFIENSIEHGFTGIDYKGHIEITIVKQEKYFLCTIVDNGKGIVKSDLQKKQSTSVRLISDFILKTTKTAIKMLNRNDVDSSVKGVIVELLVPFKFTEND